MPVGCGGADAGHPRGIGKGESGRALFGDQSERRLQQRLFQIAVMIAALGAALFLAPAHVNAFYMSRAQSGSPDGPVARMERSEIRELSPVSLRFTWAMTPNVL